METTAIWFVSRALTILALTFSATMCSGPTSGIASSVTSGAHAPVDTVSRIHRVG